MSKFDHVEGHSCPGRTLMEILDEGLDEIMDSLMIMVGEGWGGSDKERAEMRGQAKGYSWALALLRNPYIPEDELIKIKAAAMRRWESRQVGEEGS